MFLTISRVSTVREILSTCNIGRIFQFCVELFKVQAKALQKVQYNMLLTCEKLASLQVKTKTSLNEKNTTRKIVACIFTKVKIKITYHPLAS